LQIDKERRACELLKKNYEGTLNSASYRLGHLLLHETRSFKDLLALPWRVVRIFRQARERAREKQPLITDPERFARRFRAVVPGECRPVVHDDLRRLKIACITDTFTHRFFASETQLYPLDPDSWQTQMESVRPDMLLVESAWRGQHNRWEGKIERFAPELAELLVYCRKNGIVTAFWNKEDPVYFENFKHVARFFNTVFTSDAGCIDAYRHLCGHERVYALPFGAQPAIHNPVETYDRKDAVVFAGTYYHRYAHRNAALESFMVHLLPEFEIDIYDREHGNDKSDHRFPEAYRPFIRGHLPYDKIDLANKGYRYAVNLNSVTDSPTMFARRVFELVACNTTVLSNESLGVRQLFGDCIVMNDDGARIAEALRALRANPVRAQKIRLIALRKVMSEHTARNRLAYLASMALQKSFDVHMPEVTVVAAVRNDTEAAAIYRAFKRQRYDRKFLLLIAEKELEGRYGDTEVRQKRTLSSAILCELLQSPWIARMDPGDYYGENYLLDLMLSTQYGTFDAIGKTAYYERLSDGRVALKHNEAAYCIGKPLCFCSSIVNKALCESFSAGMLDDPQIDAAVPETAARLGTDPFNYCKNGAKADDRVLETVCDLKDIDAGVSLCPPS